MFERRNIFSKRRQVEKNDPSSLFREYKGIHRLKAPVNHKLQESAPDKFLKGIITLDSGLIINKCPYAWIEKVFVCLLSNSLLIMYFRNHSSQSPCHCLLLAFQLQRKNKAALHERKFILRYSYWGTICNFLTLNFELKLIAWLLTTA